MVCGHQHEARDSKGTVGTAKEAMNSLHEYAFLLAGMSGGPGQPTNSGSNGNGGCYRFGGWRLDPCSGELIDPEGSSVPLTDGEYALLIAFLDAPQQLLPRDYLAQAARIHDDRRDPCLDVLLLGLRRKLEIDARSPKIILTQRGEGYIFALDVERP